MSSVIRDIGSAAAMTTLAYKSPEAAAKLARTKMIVGAVFGTAIILVIGIAIWKAEPAPVKAMKAKLTKKQE